MKISSPVYDEWLGEIPSDAFFIFAYLKKNWKTKLSTLSDTTNGGGTNITDYQYDILEMPDGIRTDFTLRYNYVSGSCHAYLNGSRLTPDDPLGTPYDFIELGGRIIRFNEAPLADPPGGKTLIVVDYLTTDIINGIFTEQFNEIFQ